MEVASENVRTLANAPVDDAAGIDRISGLPNDTLCHILSFLPTKFAVGTSVLSVRWKDLFASIPNLQIVLNDTLLLHPDSTSDMTLINFKSFVDRLLNVTLRGVTSASRFHLHCEKFNDGRDIAKWIDGALHLNVNLMSLYLRQPSNPDSIFDSLFGANITNLTLMLDFTDTAPEYRFSFPNLKALSVLYMGANAVNVLLEGCPVLDHLQLCNCIAKPEEVFRIRNSSLRVLKFHNGKDCFDGDLEISASNLQHLLFDGFHPNQYLVQRLESLRAVHLSLDEGHDVFQYGLSEEFSVLINALSCTQWLRMSANVIRMFHYWRPQLSVFGNLVGVQVYNMDTYAWKLVGYLLYYIPTFKYLRAKSGFDINNYEKFKRFMNRYVIPLPSVTLLKRGGTNFELVFERKAMETKTT